MPLSYDAGDLDVRIGDVVRVPIGSREHVAFIVSAPQHVDSARPLRRLNVMPDVPRAFDEMGLALARFIAQRYLCTLGEALSAVALAAALPRTVDSFVRTVPEPDRRRYPSVPERLVRLIWEDLSDGFSLEQLLRNPDARRAGDRASLLAHVRALVRSGEIRRERRVVVPRTSEYRISVLMPGTSTIRGPKAAALAAFVRQQPGVPRADALLAGFSNAVISRALKTGAIVQTSVSPAADKPPCASAPAPFEATPEQRAAIDALAAGLHAGAFREMLLHGITGSGKTFVYIEAIARVLRAGGHAIVLVPEISLTPQTARRFEQAFGARVAVVHSALSERERFDAWQACARGAVDVVVGARSAVFAPLPNVRLIVVDEAHESSYKQETSPRYHAVAVARERMRLAQGVLLLGSATPSLESYAHARSGAIETIRLHERATGLPLPAVRVVDMKKEFEEGNRRIFSMPLTQALSQRLERGEKSVLFVNRRGSAGFLLCRSCGAVPGCRRCSVSMTVHRDEGLLRCHYCDAQRPLPGQCEICGNDSIREFGVGTQRVEQEVRRLYPSARIVRMDSDTTTRIGDHARLLDAFAAEGDVLVGTQMVAKGLDFPTVTLVGVVAADIGLHAPDYRAAERVFDVVMQVCGRSGRARPGEAVVQTYSPAHPAIVCAAAHDYDSFAERELAERVALGYPPACELIYLGVIARRRSHALERAERYAQVLRDAQAGEVLGPAPYPIARLNDEWRFRVAVKTVDESALRTALITGVMPLARADRASRLVISVES